MQESNTVPTVATDIAAPASSTQTTAPGVNGRKARIYIGTPLAAAENGKAQPSEPPPAQIVDANLDEDDLQITLIAQVRSRKKVVANCRCTATVYDAVRTQNRGTFFQTMERLIAELKQGAAIKVNNALSIDPAPCEPKKTGNGGKPPLFAAPLPPFVRTGEQEGLPDSMKIHEPPDLNAH